MRLSFEDLTDSSDVIASGQITRSWTAWDDNHKYIWTHYELSVASRLKAMSGRAMTGSTVEFAEPGGTLDGVALTIPGTPAYQPGEKVLVFLERMPNGYLRTTGWAQGRYGIRGDGRLQASSRLKDLQIVNSNAAVAAAKTAPNQTLSIQRPVNQTRAIQTLEGMSLNEAGLRIAARLRATAARGNAGASSK